MRLVKNIIWLLLASGTVSAAVFLNQALLFKWLSPADYDGVVMLVTITATAMVASHLGIPLALTKLLARQKIDGSASSAAELISDGLLLTVLTTAAFMVLLGLGGLAACWAGVAPAWGPWLVVTPLWLLAASVMRLAIGVTNGYEQMAWSAAGTVLLEGGNLAGLAAVKILGPSLGSVVAVYTVVAVVCLAAALVGLALFLRCARLPLVRPRRAGMIRLGREGLHFYVPHAVTNLTIPLLILIVYAFARTPGDVGTFRICVAVSALILLPITPAGLALLPRLSTASGRHLRTLVSWTLRISSLYSIAALAAILFGANLLDRLGYGKLSGPLALLYWLSFSRAMQAITLATDTLLKSQHTARVNARAEAGQFVALLALALLLAWQFGPTGAAVALGICAVGRWLVQFVLVRTCLHLRLTADFIEAAALLAVLLVVFASGAGLAMTIGAVAVAAAIGLVTRRTLARGEAWTHG